MADYVPPKQTPEKYDHLPSTNAGQSAYAPVRSGGGGGAQIAIGLLMLVGGIGLSVAGTGRVFIGLIAVGVITLVKGIAAAGK